MNLASRVRDSEEVVARVHGHELVRIYSLARRNAIPVGEKDRTAGREVDGVCDKKLVPAGASYNAFAPYYQVLGVTYGFGPGISKRIVVRDAPSYVEYLILFSYYQSTTAADDVIEAAAAAVAVRRTRRPVVGVGRRRVTVR